MARIATSVEESKRLLELGINPKSADMKILPFGIDIKRRLVPIDDIAVCGNEDEVPAWSLGALIELLPPKIIVKDEDGELRLWLNIQKMGIEYKSAISEISEMYLYGDLIVSIIVAIESLVEQGYIKTKEE